MDLIKTLLSDHSDEVIFFLGTLSVITFLSLVLLWIYNKKKFNNLKHAIPADVVKNYLDSIIQNSSALKSSLFRGDLDVGKGAPSIMPVQGMGGGESVSVSAGNDAELIQKEAELATLRAQITERASQVGQLEGKCSDCNEQLKVAKDTIAELEAKLANAGTAGGGADPAEVESLKKERDTLNDKLKEYAVIEDDLANLKRLQQENEQLKKSLAEAGGEVPAAQPVDGGTLEGQEPPAAAGTETIEGQAVGDVGPNEIDMSQEVASGEENTLEGQEVPAPQDVPEEDQMSAASLMDDGPPPEDDKSPDDLLSEFEKMLS